MDSLKQEKQALGTLKPWATKATPMYSYDFDNDGRIEKMVFEKRDGEDRLNIHDWWGKKIFTVNFDSYSLKSKIYKILITKISQNVDLSLFFDFRKQKYINIKADKRPHLLGGIFLKKRAL